MPPKLQVELKERRQKLAAAIGDGQYENEPLQSLLEQVDAALKTFNHGHLVIVMGSKGGVGCSTIAINLGVQLAQMKKRVVLLDFAQPLGHAALMLDIQARFSLLDAIQNLDRLDEHFLQDVLARHESGLQVLAGNTDPERWQTIAPAALCRVAETVSNLCDYLVVDAGSTYSSEWSPMLSKARRILLVAQTTVSSLWGLEEHIAVLRTMFTDPQQIMPVLNRWKHRDEMTLKSVEKRLGFPLFRLSNNYSEATAAANMGCPFMGNGANNPLAAEFHKLIAEITGVPVDQKQRRRLFSWASFT